MNIGAVFPQTELGADPGEIREYVQAAEGMGYSHIFVADHVLGADPAYHPEVPRFPYTYKSTVHEPFTLLGYAAALTTNLGLATGIVILPQRQTVLVAKQAAEVDILSGGRMRLGVGVGWNPVEYEALGEDFGNRGRRVEEQIEVLRALWTQEVVTYDGRWHKITSAGLNPMPAQRPIPIWIGAGRGNNPYPPEAALRRIARLADGWFPMFDPGDEGFFIIEKLRSYTIEAGRDPSQLQIEGRIRTDESDQVSWASQFETWKALGATHISFDARRGRAGILRPIQEHLDNLRRFMEAVA